MKLIVGLGNPGRRYINTRHNIGFRLIDELAKRYKVRLKKKLFGNANEARLTIFAEEAMLVQPLTFMNLSGGCVSRYARKNNISLDSILVVCDDVNLCLGEIRIRPQGTSGGHNGVESVIRSLNTEVFPRLRIGVGRKDFFGDLTRYVLSDFEYDEAGKGEKAIGRAADACECWIKEGIEKTMNLFNK